MGDFYQMNRKSPFCPVLHIVSGIHPSIHSLNEQFLLRNHLHDDFQKNVNSSAGPTKGEG